MSFELVLLVPEKVLILLEEHCHSVSDSLVSQRDMILQLDPIVH